VHTLQGRTWTIPSCAAGLRTFAIPLPAAPCRACPLQTGQGAAHFACVSHRPAAGTALRRFTPSTYHCRVHQHSAALYIPKDGRCSFRPNTARDFLRFGTSYHHRTGERWTLNVAGGLGRRQPNTAAWHGRTPRNTLRGPTTRLHSMPPAERRTSTPRAYLLR